MRMLRHALNWRFVGLFIATLALSVIPFSLSTPEGYWAHAESIPAGCPTGTTQALPLTGVRNVGCYDARGTQLKILPVEESIAFAEQNGQTWQQYAGAYEQQRIAASRDPSCSIWNGTATFNCWFWIPFMSALGTIFLTIGGAVLLLAGVIFDWFVQHLVVQFGTTMDNLHLLGPIQKGWQLFRDLANIVIIGVFVFVAIMTILGSGEYGAKRLISRVLIVAILINFSLLFTRIIVDSTNFVSAQVMKTMPEQQTKGIAQSFLDAFGIKDVWSETSSVVRKVGNTSESGWAALVYGFVGGVALLFIAYVLLYGAYVIIARAILLVIAMLTSSLAFASYLLPATSRGTFFSWNTWWSNLLKAALFGPLLMIFLWITMQFITLTNANTAGTAIGKIADNPSPTNVSDQNWESIVLLIIGTGLLFVSIRAASSFASSIAGLSAMNFGVGASLAIGSRFAGFLGRQGAGRVANFYDKRNDKWLSKAKVDLADLENSGASARRIRMAQHTVDNLLKDKKVYGGLAKSTFSAVNTGLGKQLVKSLGAGSLIGGKTESFGARAEKIAKESAKNASARMLSDDEKKKLTDIEKGRAKEQLKVQKELVTQQKEAAQTQVKAAEKTLETVKGSQEYQKHVETRQEAERATQSIRAIADEKTKQMARGGSSNEDVQKHLAQRDSDLRREKDKIERARTTITQLESGAIKDLGAQKEHLKGIDNTLSELNDPKKLQQTIDATAKQKVSEATLSAEKAAQEKAAEYAAGWWGSTNSTVANMARDGVKKSRKEEDEGGNILKVLQAQIKAQAEGAARKQEDMGKEEG